MSASIRCLFVIFASVSSVLPTSLAIGQQAQSPDGIAEPPKPMRSLGIFVTQARMSKVTDSGLQAIPQGALVSVVEDAMGQKFAVFKNIKLPISNMNMLSSDPSKIAASATNKPGSENAGALSPGMEVQEGANVAPKASTNEQIRVDSNGNIISRSKTTTINDGAGNTTTIMQGRSGGMSPEQAGKLAAAQQRINQQREAISELKNRRAQKKVMAGYESKLREMTDLLSRMEVEMARMRIEFSN